MHRWQDFVNKQSLPIFLQRYAGYLYSPLSFDLHRQSFHVRVFEVKARRCRLVATVNCFRRCRGSRGCGVGCYKLENIQTDWWPLSIKGALLLTQSRWRKKAFTEKRKHHIAHKVRYDHHRTGYVVLVISSSFCFALRSASFASVRSCFRWSASFSLERKVCSVQGWWKVLMTLFNQYAIHSKE